MITMAVFQTLLFSSRVAPFRASVAMELIFWVAFSIQNYFEVNAGAIEARIAAVDCLLNFIFTVAIILAVHDREMKTRKHYN